MPYDKNSQILKINLDSVMDWKLEKLKSWEFVATSIFILEILQGSTVDQFCVLK